MSANMVSVFFVESVDEVIRVDLLRFGKSWGNVSLSPATGTVSVPLELLELH